ncbi:LysR family transcriptional regulator (plasmid) [Rhodococcus sp. USK10]|uniref:LysR family transcriptional regulator n=1 Tax=Rhodococcus sp. USK10 TaxID=2789739 RepID=UPI001C5D694C|nr:LysR family transcriptional regulator [Rhodococcus sp. USK10]QYB00165.1 LysR family transcriptional regulator [Rhodococcus sp. USK10]
MVQPRDLDIRTLYTLEAIHRLGSISAAADELGLSQPAVSHALRKLRHVFSDPLFIRAGTGITPTPRATQLAASARRIESLVNAEVNSATEFDPQQLRRKFRLLMTDPGELVLLPRLLRKIRSSAPQVTVESSSRPAGEMAEALDSGVADLAIGPFPELALSHLRQERLYRRSFLCLYASDHPTLSRKGLTLETYLGESHLSVRSTSRTEEIFEQFLAENGYTRNVVVTVPHMLSVPAVVRESDLIATVPQAVGAFFGNYPGIMAHRAPFLDEVSFPSTTVSQFWSARFEQDPAHVWLRSLVTGLFREPIAPPATNSCPELLIH